MDIATLTEAFEEFGAMASRSGIVVDLMVYGGACLALASDIRDTTKDVDVAFLSEDEATRDAAKRIAETVGTKLGLPSNWLSQAVRTFLVDAKPADPNLCGEYPTSRHHAIGLRIFVPHPAYMLAMKVASTRWGGLLNEKTVVDTDDAAALMEVAGIETRDELVALLGKVYPNRGIVPRLEARIDEVMERHENGGRPNATWHAPRGAPP